MIKVQSINHFHQQQKLTGHVSQVDSDRDIPVNVIFRANDLDWIDEISRIGSGKRLKLLAKIVVQNASDELILQEGEDRIWLAVLNNGC